MGMSSYVAELIIREHRYRPLPPVVHTVGRLVVGLDFKHACSLFNACGVDPVNVSVEIDHETIESSRFKKEHGLDLINDRTFFGMLGVKEVRAIDINSYEGAEVICDLCVPIPDELADTVDFIVGGSTLDNVFDPAQYIKNIAKLLRPGGRLFEFNIYVDRYRPYIILPPPWYYDFFVVNEFDDCKVYVIESVNGIDYAFKVLVGHNPEQQVGWGLIDNFEPSSDALAHIIAFAEKGVRSTCNLSPVQDAWRDAERVKKYNNSLHRVLQHPRPYSMLVLDDSRPPSFAAHSPPRNYHYIGHF
jgi:SAM-dependent methyltransferase